MTKELEQRILAFQKCVEDQNQEAAKDLLDDDFALVLVQPAQAVMPRERWMEVLPDYLVHSYDVEDQIVDVDVDCASVLQRVHMKATVLGQDRSGVFVTSDFWRLRDKKWCLWRRHSTPMSADELPGTEI